MMEQKIEALRNAVARGYFIKADAEAFGKAGLWIGTRDMTALGVSEEEIGTCFYRLHAFECEPEVKQAGREMNLTVRDMDEMTEFSFFMV
ncbi:MAG: hypothetical protein ACYC55_02925 [Candidatus Geothermincolia bacterium]